MNTILFQIVQCNLGMEYFYFEMMAEKLYSY